MKQIKPSGAHPSHVPLASSVTFVRVGTEQYNAAPVSLPRILRDDFSLSTVSAGLTTTEWTVTWLLQITTKASYLRNVEP